MWTLAIILLLPALTSANCPNEGIWHESSGICYRYFSQPKSFEEAVKVCETTDSILASASSPQLNNFIHVRALQAIYNDTQLWLGGRRQGATNLSWIDGTNSNYSDFDNSEDPLFMSTDGKGGCVCITATQRAKRETEKLEIVSQENIDGECLSMSLDRGFWQWRNCERKLPFVCASTRQFRSAVTEYRFCPTGFEYHGSKDDPTKGSCYKVLKGKMSCTFLFPGTDRPRYGRAVMSMIGENGAKAGAWMPVNETHKAFPGAVCRAAVSPSHRYVEAPSYAACAHPGWSYRAESHIARCYKVFVKAMTFNEMSELCRFYKAVPLSISSLGEAAFVRGLIRKEKEVAIADELWMEMPTGNYSNWASQEPDYENEKLASDLHKRSISLGIYPETQFCAKIGRPAATDTHAGQWFLESCTTKLQLGVCMTPMFVKQFNVGIDTL